jgi:2-polyprenyl-6-methoxyphenol hydroxylase-like FAD-dependent oxidoreductase
MVQLESGSQLEAAVVVAADGARSKIARTLGLPMPNYAGYTAYR